MIKRLMNILDGTPAAQGEKPPKGQSVVEMAFITPLLIILIVGIVEVGWLANNYLILLEVTRVGARRGAVLTGDLSPANWNERGTLNPLYDENLDPFFDPSYPRADNGDPQAPWPDESYYDAVTVYTSDQWAEVSDYRTIMRNCEFLADGTADAGFYNLVLCQMLGSLDPLEIKEDADRPIEERTDDIIISAFAIQMVSNGSGGDDDFDFSTVTPESAAELDPEKGPIPGLNAMVVGRYPARANECNVYEVVEGGGVADPGTPVLLEPNEFERDPFDFINDGVSLNGFPTMRRIDYSAYPGVVDGPDADTCPDNEIPCDHPIELAVMVNGVWVSPGYDPPNIPEMQRGFNFTGYRRVEGETITRTLVNIDTGATFEAEVQQLCFGSEKDIYWLQERIIAEDFELTADEINEMRATDPTFGYMDDGGTSVNCLDSPATLRECNRQFLVSQGVVLVEIYWRHELLLDFPVFSPVFNALGTDDTTIHVWSAFPAPSIVPDIRFKRSAAEFCGPVGSPFPVCD